MNRADTQAAVMPAEMAVVPQAISAGEMKSLETLTQLRDGRTGSDQMGLFVQQIGTTRGVTDTQPWGRRRSCHQHLVMAGEESS